MAMEAPMSWYSVGGAGDSTEAGIVTPSAKTHEFSAFGPVPDVVVPVTPVQNAPELPFPPFPLPFEFDEFEAPLDFPLPLPFGGLRNEGPLPLPLPLRKVEPVLPLPFAPTR